MNAKLLRKHAYGMDQSGEVQDNRPKDIEDTSTPDTLHETSHNRVNQTPDSQAAEEFPGLGKHQQRFPSRGRN